MIKMIRNVSWDTSEMLDRQRKAMKVKSAAVMLRYFVRQFEVHLKERGKAEMKIAVGNWLISNVFLSGGDLVAFKMLRGVDQDTWERFSSYALLMGRITQASMLRYFVLDFQDSLGAATAKELSDLQEIVKSYISEEWE